MRVDLFMISDHANLTNDGKLNIFGVFDTINAKKFPARHSEFFVVGKIKPDISEFGKECEVSIKLMTGDKIVLHQVTGKLKFSKPQNGVIPAVNIIFRINDLVFEKADIYEFGLFVDIEQIASSSLQLNLIS